MFTLAPTRQPHRTARWNESMTYDFITAPDRRNTGSFKWDQMHKWNPDVPAGTVPFSVADMELRNAPEICKGLADYAMADTVFGYTGPTDSYLQAVVEWMSRRHNWTIKTEWIQPIAGVVPAFFTAVQAFTEPGDGVIIMTPVYYPFYMAMETSGRTTVKNPLIQNGDTYDIDFEDLERKASDPSNKVLLFCSPHNPVGRVWSRDELLRIIDICQRNSVLIISDEIHNDLILPGHHHTVMATLSAEASDNMIVCTAPSKTFNLAGLATSNIIIPNSQIKEQFTNAAMRNGLMMVNCFGLRACEIAYREAEPWLDELLLLIERNFKQLKAYLNKELPEARVFDLQGTYLVWIDFNFLEMDKDQLEEFMHAKALMFFDEGYIFGEDGVGFERINIACPSSVLMESLERMVAAVRAVTAASLTVGSHS